MLWPRSRITLRMPPSDVVLPDDENRSLGTCERHFRVPVATGVSRQHAPKRAPHPPNRCIRPETYCTDWASEMACRFIGTDMGLEGLAAFRLWPTFFGHGQ